MATRSTIALEFDKGYVSQVYCHWDGYIEHNGKILLEHYSNPKKLEELLSLGDLSQLGPNIGEKHPFEESTKNCKFYGRDRGEKDVQAENFKDFEEMLDKAGFQEYNYILRNDGNWYVNFGDSKKFTLLTQEFKKIESESLK